MSEPLHVAAVIPNWNGGRQLKILFESLQKQTRKFDAVIVADNGSSDDSLAIAEAAGATVIRFASNRGFAPAVNAGVRHAEMATYVAILNNDIYLDADWLSAMLAGVGDATVACGKVLSMRDPSRIDATWDALSCAGTALRCGSGFPDGDYWSQPRTIQMAPLTAGLVHRDHFLALGGLDEKFGSYLEDVEFGLRCGSKRHTQSYIPEAVCLHEGSATLGYWNPRTVRQIARNQVLLLARHFSSRSLLRFGWKIAVGQALWACVAARHGRFGSWLRGKFEGIAAWRVCRRSSVPLPDAELIPILLSGEAEIREVQNVTRWDLYWWLYFALT